jgi:hypothetical protein
MFSKNLGLGVNSRSRCREQLSGATSAPAGALILENTRLLRLKPQALRLCPFGAWIGTAPEKCPEKCHPFHKLLCRKEIYLAGIAPESCPPPLPNCAFASCFEGRDNRSQYGYDSS